MLAKANWETLFFFSWISRCSLQLHTTNLWAGTKKRPNPSIACCINCPKKSFGENWGKRKHNQMQVEQRWSLQKLDQFYERHTGFLIWEIHPFRKAFIYFSAMQYYTVYENHKKMSHLSLMNLWILMNFVNFCNLINLWIWWIF